MTHLLLWRKQLGMIKAPARLNEHRSAFIIDTGLAEKLGSSTGGSSAIVFCKNGMRACTVHVPELKRHARP